jgi:uncharacterized membrane protein
MRRLFPIRQRQDRGAVIPMVALSLTVLMTMTAFAVDLGRMRTERRDLQAAADALALDAVQMIQGLDAEAAQPIAEAEVAASATRNHVAPGAVESVHVGKWHIDTQTFQEMSTDQEYPDAVRVILSDSVKMFFDFSTDARAVSRTGVAVARGAARGELGAVLAGLQQTVDPVTAPCRVHQQVSFMNHLYTEILGISGDVEVSGDVDVDSGPCEITSPATGLKLDALSWQGLGFGRATLDDIAAEMGLGSKDALFAGTVDGRDFLDATARVLQASPDVLDVQAGTLLGDIVAAMTATTQVDIGAIVDPDTGSGVAAGAGTGDDSVFNAGVDALTLLTGTAMLINGENLASATIPLNLPYLSDALTTRIHVIEPPQTHEDLRQAGERGPRTASARVAVDVPLHNLELDLSLLGLVGTQLATGNLRFVVEVGRAESTYDRIVCPAGGLTEVDMSVETGAVTLGYGAATDSQVSGSGTVEVSPSVQVDANVTVSLPAIWPLPAVTVTLNLSEVSNVSVTETFDATTNLSGLTEAEINLLGAPSSHTFTTFGDASPWHRYPGGISGTRLADVTYGEIKYNAVAGDLLSLLGITQLSVENMIRNALDAATDSIVEDVGANIIDPLLSALGITVAGADGRILDATCQMPALANRG